MPLDQLGHWPIIARRMTVIQKGGERVDYIHITALYHIMIDNTHYFCINGKTLDHLQISCNVIDKFRVEDLVFTNIDWYLTT